MGDAQTLRRGLLEVAGSTIQWKGSQSIIGGNRTPTLWSEDATSGIAVPANATEWTNLLAAAGLTGVVNVPDALWLCQELAGNLADSIGGFTLTAAGTVSYNNAVTGWSRKGVGTSDNVAGNFQNTSASLPDLSTGDMQIVTFAALTTNTNAVRSLALLGTGASINNVAYVGGSTVLRATSGANAAQGTVPQGLNTVRPYSILSATTGSRARGYSDLEKVSPVLSAARAGKSVLLGGLGGVIGPPGARHLYAWAWLSNLPSDANLAVLLRTMGWTPLWI